MNDQWLWMIFRRCVPGNREALHVAFVLHNKTNIQLQSMRLLSAVLPRRGPRRRSAAAREDAPRRTCGFVGRFDTVRALLRQSRAESTYNAEPFPSNGEFMTAELRTVSDWLRLI